jgi:hypothetical protein
MDLNVRSEQGSSVREATLSGNAESKLLVVEKDSVKVLGYQE